MKEEDSNRSLLDKIERLAAEQQRLQRELELLKKQVTGSPTRSEVTAEKLTNKIEETFAPVTPKPLVDSTSNKSSAKSQKRSEFERFVGENLISKLGILIIIIGVGIGAKYAIENQLISPVMRIIGGYIVGGALAAVAFRLRNRYRNFSAVCLSGAIAISYFITYAGFSYYQLFPQTVAFVLMVILTVGAVYAALWYEQQVIAHFGLVGAYAVPLLLSDDSGQVIVLFSYLAIINLGILIIALRKYWKSLYYSSFVVTQLLYLSWFTSRYQMEDIRVALSFAALFFLIFYAAFLGYKLVKREDFNWTDVLLLLANAFVFYAIGYSVLEELDSNYGAGLFTLVNSAVHFGAFALIYFRRRGDRNLQHMLIALALVFVIIAIPVQLDGNWVTLLWAGMAAGLFYVGRSNKAWIYEAISYPLIALSFFSILEDWNLASRQELSLFFNIQFLSTLLFILAMTAIAYINQRIRLEVKDTLESWPSAIGVITFTVILISIFSLFGIEINRFWQGLASPEEFYSQKAMWNMLSRILLVLCIAGATQAANQAIWKSRTLRQVSVFIHPILLAIFLVSGLLILSELREIGLDGGREKLLPGSLYLFARYFAYLVFIPYLIIVFRTIKHSATGSSAIILSLSLHLTIIWVLSSELLHWTDYFSYGGSYKGVLSLLWGGYSVFLITMGIKGQKVHLRMGGIVLFGITLLKLFLYDISNLSTLSKTIIFLILGVLLLVISFIYIRFRDALWDKKEDVSDSH